VHRTTAPALFLAAAALVGACGSSSGTATTGTTAPGGTSPSSDSTTATPSSTAASSSGPSDSLVMGAVPAVDGATTLTAAPTIHAGSAPAPSVLTGSDLVAGRGTVATTANSVTVQYVGAVFTDGKVFDSSWKSGKAVTFSLANVIPGFAGGIAGMKVGGRRELVIPPSLGYGSQAVAAIPPNSTLVFVIDLVAVS